MQDMDPMTSPPHAAAAPPAGEALQRVIKVRRDYNSWVASETLEDYALRFTPRSFRKWSEMRVANTAFGAASFLVLEAVGATLLVEYGFLNAFWAIVATGLIIFLAGLPISVYAARHGVDMDLLTRGAGFGYIGSTITSLIYASFTFIFFALEAARFFTPDFLAAVDVEAPYRVAQASFDRVQASSELNRLLYLDLKLAIGDNDLLKVTRTAELAGVEALIRWPHPEHGAIPPNEFIHSAEQTGLIKPLTMWVLNAALRSLQTWQREGFEFGVAVNLSVKSLHDPQLPDVIRLLLQSWEQRPELLTFEITESALMADPATALQVLARISDIGCRLSLDDFGTGYSSLEHLKRLPVNELKIDKSFVMSMDRDSADRAIVASTSALGRSLGLRVVAEGVESAASASVLAAIGCDLAQGFHYAPPVPADQLPALVRAAADASKIGVATLARSPVVS